MVLLSKKANKLKKNPVSIFGIFSALNILTFLFLIVSRGSMYFDFVNDNP